MLSDSAIAVKIGEALKATRLRQNITQKSLSEASGVHPVTIKRMESGEIGSFDTLMRLLRVLGKLNVLQPLVEEEQLSPQEYYDLTRKAQSGRRKRAVGQLNINKEEGVSEW